jgi:predicted secreted acid phosphatase
MTNTLKKITSVFALLAGLGIPAANALNVQSKATTEQQIQQFKEYYASGSYFKDIERKLYDAKDYLDRQLQQPRHNRLAVVLDIDETALSNFRNLEQLSFTHNVSALAGSLISANSDAIPAVLAFYQHAIARNVAVFFISSRPSTPEFLEATAKNLKKVGYDQWEGLILKPIDKDEISVAEFKMNTRRRLALTYDIVLNIGDQEADFEGGYAEANVRLPNPFYGIS